MTTFPKQIERGEPGRQDALISLNRWRPASGAINQLGQARASRLIARDRNHKSTNKNNNNGKHDSNKLTEPKVTI